jgi:HK97 family phage major capsid protein
MAPRFAGNLSTLSMLRGCIHPEDRGNGGGGGGGGGGSATALKPLATDVTIADDRSANEVIMEGRREYNRLLSTFNDAETRWTERAAALEKELKAATTRGEDFEKRLNDVQRKAPEWKLEDGSLKHVAKRLVAPRGMDAGLFAATVLKPDEMRYISGLRESDAAAFNPYYRENRKRLDVDERLASKIEEFHALNDTLRFADIALAGKGEQTHYGQSGSYSERVRTLPWYDDYKRLAIELSRAMSEGGSSHVGEDWVPYFMSANLKLMVQAQCLVANLFDEIMMPTPKYDHPVEGADPVVYLIGEASSDTESTNVITADTPKSAKITLQAKKLALRILLSNEVLEDSIINLASEVLRRIGKAFARGIDETIVSGDTAGTHQDSDVTNAKDRRKAWDGLRKHALISGMPNVDLATFSTANLLSIRKGMGVYGSRPSELAWLVGFKGMIEMMKLAELITMDKYGANATVLSGEVAKFFGSPVILSEFLREDLNANAVYDGTTTTKSHVLCVSRESYTRGERRAITINSSNDRHIETDQTVTVGTWRGDFQPWFTPASAANKIVGIGRNF